MGTAREGSSDWLPDEYRCLQRHYQLRNGRELVCELEKHGQLDGRHLVDLGSGTGELTEEIRRNVGSSGRVVGVDTDVGMVERARQHSDCEFVVADLHAWLGTQSDDRWDVVFSNAALHWLESVGELSSVFVESRRVLRSGGFLAARFSLCGNGVPGKDILESVLREFYGASRRVHRSPHTYQGSIRMVEEADFESVTHRRCRFPMFEDVELAIAWMLASQPLRRYVKSADMERFTRVCAERWRAERAVLWADHILMVAQARG